MIIIANLKKSIRVKASRPLVLYRILHRQAFLSFVYCAVPLNIHTRQTGQKKGFKVGHLKNLLGLSSDGAHYKLFSIIEPLCQTIASFYFSLFFFFVLFLMGFGLVGFINSRVLCLFMNCWRNHRSVIPIPNSDDSHSHTWDSFPLSPPKSVCFSYLNNALGSG